MLDSRMHLTRSFGGKCCSIAKALTRRVTWNRTVSFVIKGAKNSRTGLSVGVGYCEIHQLGSCHQW